MSGIKDWQAAMDQPIELAELLARRPDLAGLGVTYLLEAVCA